MFRFFALCFVFLALVACVANTDTAGEFQTRAHAQETGSTLGTIELVPEPPITNTGSWGKFDLQVDIYAWIGDSEDADTCVTSPCLDYAPRGSLSYAETTSLTQNQSWPVMITWSASVPVTLPALGINTAAVSGEAYFNPWRDLEVAICHGSDCQTTVIIDVVSLPVRTDCREQVVDGMYSAWPNWFNSQGEAYGVSNLESEYCTHWSCTDSAPAMACPANDQPNEVECAAWGCECNLNPWSQPTAHELQYNAAVTAASGVRAPWFADRWETGGMHATNDGNTVFRMSTQVALSDAELLFRPVIDMRTNWDGMSWDTFPRPDGWEGPPVFRNSVNEFLAPASGYWPIEWEVSPDSTVTDIWMQPVWNVIVKPGGETGTANLRNLGFQACGSAVDEVSCTPDGCSF